MIPPLNEVARITLYYITLLLIPLVGAAQTDTDAPEAMEISSGIQTHETLKGRTIKLTGRTELHVTGSGNPIEGSEINLDSPDAWLFLEKVRPADVLASNLTQIRVKGAPAVNEFNVRVAGYAMGSVVIPHPADYKPMQIWSEPSFEGDTLELIPASYYYEANLGKVCVEGISSFKLKRGYMATIAQQEDGGGLSRVYVAQDGDITVSALPWEFDNRIRYIRVLPWQWIGKKGWCGENPERLVDPLWWYNWGATSVSFPNIEFVPMKWNDKGTDYRNINSKAKSTHLLGFNEPNSSHGQANMTVAEALREWPKLMMCGLRVGGPATTDGGIPWTLEFHRKAQALDYRVDYACVHFYRCGQSARQLYDYMRQVHEATGLPVWLTEWNNGANWTNCPDPTPEENARVIGEWLKMLEETPWVERYSVYNWVEDCRALELRGEITPAGVVYRDFPSRVGYLQEIPAGASREARYEFKDDVIDESGKGNDAMLVGTTAFVEGSEGEKAIQLDGKQSWVVMPAGVGSSRDFTFAGWVKWDGGDGFQRVFDLGLDRREYLFLTPSSDGENLTFAITTNGRDGEKRLQAPALKPGEWTHVAVTIMGSTGTLYVNGKLVATNGEMNVSPGDVRTKYNYLGKSHYPDPLFAGQLQDIRFIARALTESEVNEVMKGGLKESGRVQKPKQRPGEYPL